MQTGTPGAANNNKPDPWSEVQSVYYSKAAGYVTPEIAYLKNKKRQMRQAERIEEVVVPAEASNAADTASAISALRLGSG